MIMLKAGTPADPLIPTGVSGQCGKDAPLILPRNERG